MMTPYAYFRRAGSRGFTMFELLVAMAMSTMVLVAMVGIFYTLKRSYTQEAAKAVAQENIRAVMDLMVSEIRLAGLNPLGANAFSGGFVATADSTSDIQFVADLNYNGILEDGETIHYYVKKESEENKIPQMIRQVSGDISTTSLLDNWVENTAADPDDPTKKIPVFAYYDKDGVRIQPTTVPLRPSTVLITLTVEEPGGPNGTVTRTLTQRVRLRNII